MKPLILLIFPLFLGAEMSHFINADFRRVAIEDSSTTNHEIHYQFESEIAQNLFLQIKNKYFNSERNIELRNSFRKNELRTKLAFIKNNDYCKIQYGNRWFDENLREKTFSEGIFREIKQKCVQNIDVQIDKEWQEIKISIYGKYRNLGFEHYLDDDTIPEFDRDLYLKSEISYKINSELALFFDGYFKDDLNDSNRLNQTIFSSGIHFQKKVNHSNFIDVKSQYYFDDFREIQHNCFSQLRYTKRVGNKISGFISYLNRACLEQNKFYRVSTMLRAHLKFSDLTEFSQDSFYIFGFKYNPENSGTNTFIEFKQIFTPKIYFFGGLKIAPELFEKYDFGIEYLLSSTKNIWLKIEEIKYKNRFSKKVISAGTSLIF